MSLKVVLFLALATIAVAFPFVPVEEGIHKPLPYSFGYKIKDKHGEQHRQETGDGVGAVKGTYGFTDERGIHRQVNYVADKAGFRAEVKTNEHGTAPLDPAAVKMISSAHPYFGGAGAKGVLGGPLLAGLEAPKLIGAGLAAESKAFGVPFGIEGIPFAGPAGYAAPLLGGAITGYDSRFGAY